MVHLQLRVLACLYTSERPLGNQEIYHQFRIGKFIPLSDEDRSETYGQDAFTHEIRSTLNTLKKKGYVEHPARGVWSLSARGRLGMAKLERKADEGAAADPVADPWDVLNRWEDFMVEP